MAKKKGEHWAFEALRNRLAESTQTVEYPQEVRTDSEPRILSHTKPADWEHGTIFLFDPDLRNTLDEIFLYDLYPPILALFEDQPFSIRSLDEIKLTDAKSGIEAARNALLLMTDPECPIGTSRRPWWHIRFNLESRVIGYMLRTELLLSLPFSIEPDWVLDLLVDARDWNLPPSLSADSDELLLSFSSAVAQNHLLHDEEFIHHLTEPFRKHIRIAKAVDRFSKQPRNRLLKSNVL